MATAPTSRKLNLTRDQLSEFLTDQQQIRQFELLFKTVDTLLPVAGTDIEYQADTASATANEALASLSALAQDTAVTNAALEAKIQQALDVIPRLAQALELLAAAPVIENNNSVVADYIDFDAKAPHVDRIRRMAWNESDQTVDLGMEYDVVQQIGLETYARVQNNTGVMIPNGSVVGFTGAVPDSALSVAPYLANGSTPTLYIVGVMTHDLPDTGDRGYCTVWGFVRDVDTSSFALGDILYASPTVAGAFTNVKPTAPNNVVPIAAVLQVGTTDGVIFVRPTIEQQKYYGIFTKTTDQTPAAIDTEYLLTFDNTQISNGVIIGAPTSRIVVPVSGLYNFDATVQLTSGSSSAKNIWVWWKKNGAAVANSSHLGTSDINNGYISIALSEFFSLAANDYIELAFAADSTNVTVDSVASTAFAPTAPAVILNVTQVQQ